MSQYLKGSDESEASNLVIGLCRAVDDRDWQSVSERLTVDFRVSPEPPIEGAIEMLRFLQESADRDPDARSVHVLANIAVLQQSDDLILSAYQLAYRFRIDRVVGPLGESASRATYRLRSVAGTWKVASLHIERFWERG